MVRYAYQKLRLDDGFTERTFGSFQNRLDFLEQLNDWNSNSRWKFWEVPTLRKDFEDETRKRTDD